MKQVNIKQAGNDMKMENSNHKPVLSGNVKVDMQSFSVKNILLKYNAPILLILLFIASIILSPYFLTEGNILNLLRQQSTYLIIALGVMLTILTGGIDLSVSATAAIGSIVVVIALTSWGFTTPFGLIIAILAAIIAGAVMGAVNGFFVAKMNMAPFIVTLATMTIGEGVAYSLTGGGPIQLSDVPSVASTALMNLGGASDPVFGIPILVYLEAVIAIIFFVLMKYTTFGRLIVASGSNPKAVHLAGINEKMYKFLAYIICGGLSGLAGVIMSARATMATPATTATDYNLTTIAACVIGGCSLAGGEGTVGFTIIGVFIIALICNIMDLLSVPAYPQLIIKGIIIIAAVLMKGLSSNDRKGS